jgi:hypothetical protein
VSKALGLLTLTDSAGRFLPDVPLGCGLGMGIINLEDPAERRMIRIDPQQDSMLKQ